MSQTLLGVFLLLVRLTVALRGAAALDEIYVLITCTAGWDGSCSTGCIHRSPGKHLTHKGVGLGGQNSSGSHQHQEKLGWSLTSITRT